MPTPSSTLAEFKSPPVVEVAMGVEFSPLPRWGIPHFGLFWERVRKRYPSFKVVPPLASHIESFGPRAGRQEPTLQLVEGPEVRCWFEQADGNHLLQVQDDRFILNWRKTSSDTEYPRYENLKPEFEAAWKDFARFLEATGFGSPNLVQCEVTYVDLFPRGMGWSNPGELNRLTPVLTTFPQKLGTPEAVSVSARFVIPDELGRVHASLQPAIRAADGTEVMKLDITARGAPSGPTLDAALAWFDLGHHWAVQTFLEMTTAEMQGVWGRVR